MFKILSIFCILLISVVFAEQQKKVLVLTGSSVQHSHSQFFGSLKERGYSLTFQTADDPTLTLIEYGQYLYDHLIIFAPTIEEFGGLIDVNAIVDFIDSGHNVLIAGDEKVSDPIREIASEVGVEFEDDGALVVDHLVHDSSDNDHGKLIVEVGSELKSILGVDKVGPILYRGTSQKLKESSVQSGLLFSVLNARKTAFPSPKVNLVAALQARNNARVVVSGSLSLFSDKFFNAAVKSNDGTITGSSQNELFCVELSKWVFKERGLLRYNNVKHVKVDDGKTPDVYRIMDNITFSVDIEEWNGKKWVPYVASDVQLEFIMLDPYVRKFLKSSSNGQYSLTFTLPDVYGVFTFKVDYHRFGYTSLLIETRTPVRPFRHNEYERFIEMAFPYYASCASMLVGIFLFSLVFLYHRDTKKN